MNASDANEYVGKKCAVRFVNRSGQEVTRDLHVGDVAYVPLYGSYIVCDVEDVNLDRVIGISVLDH